VAGALAQPLGRDMPLLMADANGARTVLVVPLGALAPTNEVAERLARTARQRAVQSTIVDLSGSHGSGNGKVALTVDGQTDIAAKIDALEQQYGLVVVQLPSLFSDATIAAMRETRPVLLVAPPGPVDRSRLGSAVALLRRLGMPCAGVVIGDTLDRPVALL
jgi:acetolactate synthase regulatory subunit